MSWFEDDPVQPSFLGADDVSTHPVTLTSDSIIMTSPSASNIMTSSMNTYTTQPSAPVDDLFADFAILAPDSKAILSSSVGDIVTSDTLDDTSHFLNNLMTSEKQIVTSPSSSSLVISDSSAVSSSPVTHILDSVTSSLASFLQPELSSQGTQFSPTPVFLDSSGSSVLGSVSTNTSDFMYEVYTPSGLNVSNWTSPGMGDGGLGGEEGSGYSLAEKVVIGTILTIMVFMAVVGNLLIVAAVFTDRRLKRNSNFFIVSLAIADLLVALVVMTFAIANDILGRWVFGAIFCRIWISSDIMCSTASILNLCVISMDRYLHIRNPLHYESWMTTRRTVCLIAGVWILSVLISFVPTHLGWHENPSSGNSTVDQDLCIFDLNPIYAVVSSTISFYIPCIVMVSIYVRLYIYARRQAQAIRKTHTVDRFHNRNGSTKGSYKVSDHKAAVTLGIIMGVFLLCWVPFFIINPITAFCSTCIPQLVFQILTWCGYVNSCLNPVIYSIFNTEFRYAFRRILTPKCILNRKRNKSLHAVSSSSAANRSRVKTSDCGSPLLENGVSSSSRKTSCEKLFTDTTTTL